MYKEKLIKAHSDIKPFIHNTPVFTSSQFNRDLNMELFFKCENFQRMGAFKMRGACNAIFQIPEEKRKYGVVTHSSGNMAQAVSLAAREFNIPAYIVMPTNAPDVKKEAVKSYGAHVFFCEPTIEARQSMADELCSKYMAFFVHPSNDIDVILGQATAAKELIEKIPDLDVLIAPVGGGGLLAGTSLSVDYFAPHAVTLGAEPMEADDAKRSLELGIIQSNLTSNTIADGLRTVLGNVNFPIILEKVNRIITVSENEIIEAMRLIYERMKLVVEASSAVAFAAVIKDQVKLENKRIGIIVSGGNVDISKLPF